MLDDGSRDDSLNIARSFNDNRIRVISDGVNRGLVYRLNQLIDMCNTKYILRMDADDIMHPNRLEYQIKIMDENCDIDVLGTNAYSIDEHNKIRGVRFEYDSDIHPCKTFIHPSIIGKTDWLRGIHIILNVLEWKILNYGIALIIAQNFIVLIYLYSIIESLE